MDMDGWIHKKEDRKREGERMDEWMDEYEWIHKKEMGMDGWMDKYLPSPRSAELTSVHFSESNKSIRVSIFDLN